MYVLHMHLAAVSLKGLTVTYLCSYHIIYEGNNSCFLLCMYVCVHLDLMISDAIVSLKT